MDTDKDMSQQEESELKAILNREPNAVEMLNYHVEKGANEYRAELMRIIDDIIDSAEMEQF